MRRVLLFSCVILLLGGIVGCKKRPGAQVLTNPVEATPEIAKPSATYTTTPSRTLRPAWTLTPIPSQQVTKIESPLDKYNCRDMYSESPSKEWRFYYDCDDITIDYGNSAVLINPLTGESWNYSYCKLYPQNQDGFCPVEGYLRPTAWSPDEKYLFVIITSGGDGGTYFDFVSGLLSINLNSGLANIYLEIPAVYQFSPNADKLALISMDREWLDDGWDWISPFYILVRDLEGFVEFKLLFGTEYDDAGDIIWSPDGTRLVFIAAKYDDSWKIESSSVMLVDVPGRSRAVLIKDHPGYLEFQEWLPGDILKYRVDFDDGQIVLYSIPDRQLLTTPMP